MALNRLCFSGDNPDNDAELAVLLLVLTFFSSPLVMGAIHERYESIFIKYYNLRKGKEEETLVTQPPVVASPITDNDLSWAHGCCTVASARLF